MPTFMFKLNSLIKVDAVDKKTAKERVGREIYEHLSDVTSEAKYVSKRPTNTTEFIETVIQPIAKKLQKEFPGYTTEVIGPFGLSVEVLIIMDNGNKDETKSLTFRPGNNFELRIVNFSKTINDFAPGTIGAYNNMNFGTEQVPKKNRINWLKQRLEHA